VGQFAQRHPLGARHGIAGHLNTPVGKAFGHHFGFIFSPGMALPCTIIATNNKDAFARLDMTYYFIYGFLNGGMHVISP
jgi:hypothetical protein